MLRVTEAENIYIGWYSSSNQYSWKSTGNDKAIYDSLCRANNDVAYNRKVGYIKMEEGFDNSFDEGNVVGQCYEKIINIDIISESDFDAQHPIGTSLSDIVHFCSTSVSQFIESGYTFKYDWKSATPELFNKEPELFYFQTNRFAYQCTPVDKLLSEMKTNDFYLLNPGLGFLIFDKQPTLSKTHLLTVSVTLDDGRVLSGAVTKTFN